MLLVDATPFVVRVSVVLTEPKVNEEDRSEVLRNYFRVFGVTAASEVDVKRYLSEDVTDGEIEWEEFAVASRGRHKVPQDILEQSSDTHREGIWYRSGRVFF